MPPTLRDQLPALANKAYFNYGGQGPLPTPSLEAMVTAWQRIQELGPFTDDVWPFVESTVARLRRRLGCWLGVPPHRLSFTENVTSGCVLPLWGLPWQAGDALLLSDCEHPGVVAACRELAHRHGLSLHSLPVADLLGSPAATDAAVLERLEAALTPRTRLVVLSHLLWNTGQIMPLEQVAAHLQDHPRRPWLLADAAQALGSLPVAAAAAVVDIYACTGHKWCCGPEGLGVVALSERVLAEARPTLIGWRSLSHEGTPASGFHADGRRFEVATSCIPLFAGLDCSLQLLETEGSAEERHARLRRSAGDLWRQLQDVPGLDTLLQVEPPAGLVSFTLAGMSPVEVVGQLGRQRVWLRSLDQPACLRACTHLPTNAADLEALLNALRSTAKT
ncbi:MULTISPECIES: aminotransferase class V-fold PLP-dependent enzyme [Aphanothece]|uniref:aminotransferase class V-fold PLP-dependent enzyme n=1 Tax=Aphanothece TaxID=1121 RepID=UPI00398545CC